MHPVPCAAAAAFSPARRAWIAAVTGVLWAGAGAAAAQSPPAPFDHRHAAWDALLKQQVVVAPGGNASTVRYAALKGQRGALRAYLDALSAVAPQAYGSWSKPQQLAFLINAYNAYTVELILSRGTTAAAQADIRAGRYKLAYLDYDWALNDAR